MIATYLIQEIVDLTVCLNGDEPTQAELESLNEFSIEELIAKREDLLIQLAF